MCDALLSGAVEVVESAPFAHDVIWDVTRRCSTFFQRLLSRGRGFARKRADWPFL